MRASDWAWAAAAFVWLMVPLTMPGPPSKPVIELPGDRPTSPLTIVGPVFVPVLAPSTPYEAAVPRLTGPARTVAADAARETPSGRGSRQWRECGLSYVYISGGA